MSAASRWTLRSHAAVLLLLAALTASGPAAAQLTVSGSNNIGVGVNNGSIVNGLSESQVAALLKAQGKQRDELLRKIVADLNQQAQRAAFTEGAVLQFVSTLTRRQVPQSEWQQALGEITRRYLELEARLAAIPFTSEAIKALVARAEAARQAGRFDEADALLGEAADAAKADARKMKDQARTASRQAASVLASQASLALTRLDREKGVRLLIEAFEQRADDVEPETFNWLIEAGDAAVTDGRSARAVVAYQHAQMAAQGRLLADLGNTQWQRGLSISHNRIGDVQVAQGELVAALKSFQAGMEIARSLSARDPGNTEWQRDLSISHNKIGDVQVAQGELGGALKSFQAGMEIGRQLSARDPGNTQWQRDLSISHDRIGDVQVAQGELGGALKSFQAGMEIGRQLSARDPGNTQWQRDLSISHNKIGDVQVAQGELGGALKSFQAGMEIRRQLSARDPGNAQWQTDVAISCWKIGQLETPALQKAERRRYLQQGLAVLEALQQQGRLEPRRQSALDVFRRAIAALE